MQAALLTGLLLIHHIEETCVLVCTAESAKPFFCLFVCLREKLRVNGISLTKSYRVATHSPSMASSVLVDIMWL